MALTPLPTAPSTSDPANFATRADAFVAALATLVTEINAGNFASAASALTGTTLAAGVVTSSLTTVGALNSGSITSGFGSIDVGADAISGGAISGTTGNFSGILTPSGSISFGGRVNTSASTYTWLANRPSVSFNAASTVTLLSVTTYNGMIIYALNYSGGAIISDASNVIDLAGNVTNVITAASKWAILMADGTYWRTIAGN